MNSTESTGVTDVTMNIIAASVWTIVTLLSLAFNILCLTILPRVESINGSTKVFLGFMTAADLNLGVFCYLPMIGVSLAGGMWPYGAFCYVQAWIIRQGIPMDMLSVLLVTIDRYIAVVYPLRYGTWVTPTRAWILSCCAALSTHLYSLYSLLSNQTIFNETLQMCIFGVNNLTTYIATFTFGGVWFFVILAMYIKILKIASHHAVRIAAQHDAAWMNEPTIPNRRSFTTIFMINSVLFIGWGPFSIICVLESAGVVIPSSLTNVTEILLANVSWLNVMIYYVRNKDFKRAVHNLLIQLRRWCHCKKRFS